MAVKEAQEENLIRRTILSSDPFGPSSICWLFMRQIELLRPLKFIAN